MTARALELLARLERLAVDCPDCSDSGDPFAPLCGTCGGYSEVVDGRAVAAMLRDVRLTLFEARNRGTAKRGNGGTD